MAKAIIGVLIVIALGLNIDRLVAGADAPLRARDVGDHLVTALSSCGKFWSSGLESTWDGSQLRGWPRLTSAQHPQVAMCVISGFASPTLLLPLLQTITLAVMAVGTFLFGLCFLRRSRDASIAGSVLYLGLYYFYHEHPAAVAVPLLPALLGFLAVGGTSLRRRAVMVAGSAAIIGLTNPPAAVFLMPVVHLLLILAAPPAERRQHLIRGAGFWCAYAVYYAPTMVGQFSSFAESSRSLYQPGGEPLAFWPTFSDMFLNAAIISPAAVLLATVDRRTWRGTLLLIVAVVAVVAMSAANQVMVSSGTSRTFPVLVAASTMYYRLYYFVPLAVLLWATSLWDRGNPTNRTRLWRLIAMGAFCWWVAYPLSDTNRVFEPYWRYAVVIAGVMGFGVTWWTRRAWTVLLVAGVILLCARWEHTRIYEVTSQGNLFVEENPFRPGEALGRTVTISSGCDAVDVTPAQVRIGGGETLDGKSNFYDRRFVERWRFFVADNPSVCTARYAQWPTLAEVTAADLSYSADRILAWLWINNVTFVRSTSPLSYPELTLIDQREIVWDNVQTATRYLYQMEGPVSRVFAMPEGVATRAASEDFVVAEAALSEIASGGLIENIAADAPDDSHLRFEGAFDPDTTVVVSNNYHAGWRLLVDGEPANIPVEAGPFGMLAFRPLPGHHQYELAFQSGAAFLVPLFMCLGIGGLWVVSGLFASAPPQEMSSRRRRVVRLLAVAIGITAVGGLAAAVLRRRLHERDVPWFDPRWRYRRPLRTQAAGHIAPLAGFPLRVERTGEDGHFWGAVLPNGADIRFTDLDGSELPSEIEEFDYEQRRLIAWVRVPLLRNHAQTVAYLYYGNSNAVAAQSGAVWDGHYQAVWHMNPRVTNQRGSIADSTQSAHSGMFSTGLPAGGDTGVAFDGTTTRVTVADWPGLGSGSGDWTVEFRINVAAPGRNFGLFSHGEGAFHVYLHGDGFLVLERRNAIAAAEHSFAKERIEPSVWTSVAITRTRRHVRIAVDGVARSAYRVTPEFVDGNVTAPLTIGAGVYGALEGRLAEVRVSRGIARSPDWLLATFRSQAAAFVEAGAPEEQ